MLYQVSYEATQDRDMNTREIWTQKIDLTPNVWLHCSVGRASHRYSRRSGVRIPLKPWFLFRCLLSNYLNWKFTAMIILPFQNNIYITFGSNLICTTLSEQIIPRHVTDIKMLRFFLNRDTIGLWLAQVSRIVLKYSNNWANQRLETFTFVRLLVKFTHVIFDEP